MTEKGRWSTLSTDAKEREKGWIEAAPLAVTCSVAGMDASNSENMIHLPSL